MEPWPLEIRGEVPPDLSVQKMRYGGKPGAWDKSVVHVTDSLSVAGIPLEAQEYKLGSRSALDWVLERYQVKTDKASGGGACFGLTAPLCPAIRALFDPSLSNTSSNLVVC